MGNYVRKHIIEYLSENLYNMDIELRKITVRELTGGY